MHSSAHTPGQGPSPHEAAVPAAGAAPAGGRILPPASGQSSDGGPWHAAVAHALARHAGQQGSLLPILHDIQHALGYVPPEAVSALAHSLRLPRADIQGVLSFYPDFRQTPPAAVVLRICQAESCQACGAEALMAHARQRLGCDIGHTSADDAVALEAVYCLGLCAQSPAVMVNGRPYAHITPERLDRLLSEYGERP
ncbi:formate dehydrogenase subunit gamma [Pusillimonas sp. TS35]|uniref:formate dehydrogenase subunit gamma n=1 Tax=Paracandidimonas lactea TaxID=2895524 RepID=UPI00137010DE|nr:formate dehydrogenase subunit gamma [Paracandidimonas lactea]MYN14592.1 formate dehydrogenase subunit gamma [Pusillimonas sp. TS35]